MKHNAHQFEFSATTEVFNLAGEVMRGPEPPPAAPTSNNRTPELIFVDHAEAWVLLPAVNNQQRNTKNEHRHND
jgi:hypothetical protein